MCRKLNKLLNNELKFHIVNIYYRMSGAMNRHCIPGLTMSTALTGNFSAECPGIIKTMHTVGLARTRIALCQRPGADNGRKPDVMIYVERFV